MVVQRIGYLKLEAVLQLKHFSIYETKKNTCILVQDTSANLISLFYPKKDRLPWKITEGKKITSGKKIFDSRVDPISSIDTSKWNNANQIMGYKYIE